MSAQRATAPVRFARWAASAVIVALAALIVVHLASRRGGLPPPPIGSLPEDRVVDLKERIRHEEFREGKLQSSVRGDRFFSGPDGRNHGEGAVEIMNYGPDGQVVSRLTAERVVYDKEAVLFGVSGRVRVEAGEILLSGDSFEYDKSGGIFRTASGGVFSSAGLAGEAREVSYAQGTDAVRLSGGFRVEFRQGGEGHETSGFSGESLDFWRRENRGRADGLVRFSGGRCLGTAATVDFDIASGQNLPARLIFRGGAGLSVAGLGPAVPAVGRLSADQIVIQFIPGSLELLQVEAEGKPRLSWPLWTAVESAFEAGQVRLKFGPSGDLLAWSASGGIRAELMDGTGLTRTIEGLTAVFDAASGAVRVEGTAGRPAVADSPDVWVEAFSISVGPGRGALDASGGVRCLFKPGEGSPAAGLFSSGEAVNVTGDKLVMGEEGSSASFAGNVRAWQGTEFLLSGELEFLPERGEVRGRGGVSAGIDQDMAGDASGRRIELGGQDMVFLSGTRTFTFASKAYAQLPGARLGADSVSAVLDREGNAVESLIAKAGVAVTMGRYNGRAENAAYQAATRRMTLTGRPVLIDDKGGSARGGKLTFDLADDKILIENEGPGRATTVIRS